MKYEPNPIPGTCPHCGEIVRKGEGRMSRVRTAWKIWHRECVDKKLSAAQRAKQTSA